MSDKKSEGTSDLIVPQVNLNGTSSHDLWVQWTAVLENAAVLLEYLRAATPHGRDYQTHPDPLALRLAQHQHKARYDATHKIWTEAEAILLALQTQEAGR